MNMTGAMQMLATLTSSPTQTNNVALFLVALVIIFRVYSLLRVVKDISRRTSHLGFQLLSIFLIVVGTPLLGLPIYFLIRPVQSKDINLKLRRDILSAQTISCQSCRHSNDVSHEFCAFCGEKLKQLCLHCHKHYPYSYLFCPFCGNSHKEQQPASE